jgi:hypothetical protein
MSEWTGGWVAEKIEGHSEVSGVALLSPQHLRLSRKKYAELIVGTTAIYRFDRDAFTQFLGFKPAVSFIVNVPKESYVAGSALRLSTTHGIPIGGLGDLMRALSLADVSEYLNKEFGFIERGLSQHSRISGFDRLDDRSYLVKRYGLEDVHVVFLNEYELTADHVRTARERYGAFKMVVITNPNGRATSSAASAASSINCRIYKWGEFLGALNRE